jgi:branched-chain amino acid transport system substrate-binding protein
MKHLAAISLAVSLGALGGCRERGGSANPERESGAAGSASEAATPPTGTIKIVSSLPRTGMANALSTAMVNGIRMALADAGHRAGPFRIEYEDWDGASAKKGDWDPEVEAANADRAVKDPDVMVYLGTLASGAAKISMPILNRASLVMISPGNTYPGLTKAGLGEQNEPGIYRPTGAINYFRVVPTDDLQGAIGARWMKQLGARTVYVLDARDLYGRGIADVFEQTAGDVGLRVLGRDGIDPRAQEYKSVMTKISALHPDFVYFGGTTQQNAGQIAKDMLAVGFRAKLMVPDGCFDTAFVHSAGPENVNDRAYATFGGIPPEKLTGLGAAFVEKYRATHGKQPEAYSVYSYVAAQVAIAAIARAGVKDREAIRAAVAAYRTDDSVLGPFAFDANGDSTLSALSGNIVRNGKFEFVTTLTNESPAP